MQISRGIVLVAHGFFVRKVVNNNRLHFNKMQGIFSLGDKIELASLAGDIAVADRESVAGEVQSRYPLPQRANLFATLSGYVHGFLKYGSYTYYFTD